MALQDVWSYDHAPQSATLDISQGSSLTSYSPAGTTYNQYTDLPGMLYKNTGGTGYINTDGFLYLVSSASWNPALLVKASDVQDWTTATKYWIGFRTKTVTTRSADSSQLFNVSSNLSQTSWQPIITEGDMTTAGAGTLGVEYYVEVMIDRQNLLFEVWINGVKVKSGAIASVALASGGASYYFWGAMNSASATANATRCFKDFYFLNVDAQNPGRLGSMRSNAQSLSAVSAPNYFLGGGSLVGSASISSAQSKFGGNALTLGATAGSGVNIPDRPNLRLTGTAWTIEGWAYMTAVNQDVQFVEKSLNSTAANRAWVEFNSRQVQIKLDGTSGPSLVGSSTAIPAAGQWFHIAVVQNGTTLTVYINGTSIGTLTSSATWGNQAGIVTVGQNFSFNAPNFPGYIDELRFSNVARYTANFTPAAAAFTPDANTMLLMHFDASKNGFVDDVTQSPLGIFQQALLSPPVGMPNLSNAPTNDTLTGTLATPGTMGKIIAVDFRAAALCSQTASIASKLTQGANNLNLPSYTFADTNTMHYGRRLGLAVNAPDGGIWTPAKIGGLQVAMTPNG
jgi:hypothetical protein